jgi:hypothetical protein
VQLAVQCPSPSVIWRKSLILPLSVFLLCLVFWPFLALLTEFEQKFLFFRLIFRFSLPVLASLQLEGSWLLPLPPRLPPCSGHLALLLQERPALTPALPCPPALSCLSCPPCL